MIPPSTIQIRTNLYLWLLTGRSDDFNNAALNTGIRYSVDTTPADVVSVRESLQLDNTRSDFHVLGALAAARISTSLIREMPHEKDGVFVSGHLGLPTISASETILPPTGVSWPSFNGERAGRENFTRVEFQYVDASTALITTNNGSTETTSYSLAAEDGGSTYRLSFDRASAYGINAHFRVTGFGSGDRVAVTLSPTRYPFKEVADDLDDNRAAIRLLTSTGTMQAYSESRNPARKVGLVALAIIRSMVQEINDAQSGFEVTTSVDEEGVEPLQRLYSIDPTFSEALTDEEIDPLEPAGFHA